MAGNWSEDAIQEGYANAFQYWQTYDLNMPFDNWINRIISNSARRMSNWVKGYVRDQEETASVFDLIEKKASSPYDQHKAREAYLLIQDEDEPKRTCLQYSLVDQCTAEDVRLLTGQNENTIKTWVKRFRDDHRELYR